MQNRRNFIKKAMLLSGAVAWHDYFPPSIARAAAIMPDPGSSYLDAEHIVILMQENRSFDHCFGTLQGVRGFNDPRIIYQPNGHPVWLQSKSTGESFLPFRFDIHGTKVTWMGSTPHSRADQVDANNDGKYDQWIDAKKVGSAPNSPMTLGYYTRKDVPFNYALADAFTICDQNFCSAMTSTWPNRLYLWSGTIRGEKNSTGKAFVRNKIPWGQARWETFPEVLEKNDVSWRVYQNDLSMGGGYVGEERAWLGNFGCNPLEFLSQFNSRYNRRYVRSIDSRIKSLTKEIEKLRVAMEKPLPAEPPTEEKEELKKYNQAVKKRKKQESDLAVKVKILEETQEEKEFWTKENFDKLDAFSRNLFNRAFSINSKDADYLKLTELSYEIGGKETKLKVPAGDILHQFREDVNNSKLPTVSWLVGPQRFSDHPSSPWYGSWYLSEIMDILTKNPEVWKKTIFILTYDENDGYFDHQPPFTAPKPGEPETGICSEGIDTKPEWIYRELELKQGVTKRQARTGAIGLGYRVPMIIASPWTRGGKVCSEVFDHSSVIRFVQHWVKEKYGKELVEKNITDWRKTVVGDLTSVFSRFEEKEKEEFTPVKYKEFVTGIHKAREKPAPTNFKALSDEEIKELIENPQDFELQPSQEPGVRPSLALPYELSAELTLESDKKSVRLVLHASDRSFGEKASGAPFNAYLYNPAKDGLGPRQIGRRSYAVRAGDHIEDFIPLELFEKGIYHVCVFGPNGFYREFRGNAEDPRIEMACDYRPEESELLFNASSPDGSRNQEMEFIDNFYGTEPELISAFLGAGEAVHIHNAKASGGWYDVSVSLAEYPLYLRRYAGRIETGKDSISDPLMGRAL